ncbi:MAG: GNAT family N-acetyltransferase [Arenibacterium sp.]
MIDVRVLTGQPLEAVLDDVAALRISVFRAFPYLYDGDLEYERQYLESYRQSDKAILVGAFDGTRLIGAATGAPLADHADEFGDAFQGTGLPPEKIFYCAESVLLQNYRGRGIGHQFFNHREAHARGLGFSHVAFCAVIRPDDHPAKPFSYRALDGFWRGRGYAPLDGIKAQFPWRDVGDVIETEKPMQFWMRAL